MPASQEEKSHPTVVDSPKGGKGIVISPADALSATAQVATTIAGFAGIVVILDETPTQLAKTRLAVVLTTTFTPVVLSLFGILVLATGLAQGVVWRVCSAVSIAVLLIFVILFARRVLRFTAAELPRGSQTVFWAAVAIVLGNACLLAYNTLFLGFFWPFLATIEVSVAIAILQFAMVVLQPKGAA